MNPKAEKPPCWASTCIRQTPEILGLRPLRGLMRASLNQQTPVAEANPSWPVSAVKSKAYSLKSKGTNSKSHTTPLIFQPNSMLSGSLWPKHCQYAKCRFLVGSAYFLVVEILLIELWFLKKISLVFNLFSCHSMVLLWLLLLSIPLTLATCPHRSDPLSSPWLNFLRRYHKWQTCYLLGIRYQI